MLLAHQAQLFARFIILLSRHQFLFISLTENRPVYLERQFVELGGQRERRFVIRVVHAGQRAGAETLVIEVELNGVLAGC